MKNFSKRRGWSIRLVNGPYAGQEYRSGWALPNGTVLEIDKEISFETGVRYKREHARWKTGSKNHEAGELRYTKEGNPYYEYVWEEGTGD